MTTTNHTPTVNGDIATLASSARKSFICLKAVFNRYTDTDAAIETASMLNTLLPMVNEQYERAVIASNFNSARALTAFCRTALIALEPWAGRRQLEVAELSKLTVFLEMAINQEAQK